MQLDGFLSLQVLPTLYLHVNLITGSAARCDNLSSPHFCMLMEADNGFFTTYDCQNININPRKTNRHHLYKRRKGQEVHLFDIYALSDIRCCQGIETMIPLSKREGDRAGERQAVWWRRWTGKKRECFKHDDIVCGFTLSILFSCLSAAVYTEN